MACFGIATIMEEPAKELCEILPFFNCKSQIFQTKQPLFSHPMRLYSLVLSTILVSFLTVHSSLSGLTDCVELAKAVKSKYQVTDTIQWLHEMYHALQISKSELEKIAKSEDTNAGVSVPIADVLVGAD